MFEVKGVNAGLGKFWRGGYQLTGGEVDEVSQLLGATIIIAVVQSHCLISDLVVVFGAIGAQILIEEQGPFSVSLDRCSLFLTMECISIVYYQHITTSTGDAVDILRNSGNSSNTFVGRVGIVITWVTFCVVVEVEGEPVRTNITNE